MDRLKYLISTLGGFQFGYAIGVMAGAILFIATQFALTPEQQGWVVSAFLIGTFPGATLAGALANYLGRKRAQQLVALLFFIGTLLLITASSIPMIFSGRILQGLAAGAISVIGPLYIAEISPPERRGTYIGWYQLAVTSGIFIAYGVNFLLASSSAWQWMFGLSLIPATLHFIGFFFLPDSRPVQTEQAKVSWKAFLEPGIRTALIITILINVFQQITGVNAILYFAPSIFQACGFTSPGAALLPPIFIGIVNFGMTIFVMFYLDRWGRKPLLLLGTGGMILSLIGMVIAFLSNEATMKWLATSSMMIYIASFAIGLGPIPQLVGPELFPRKLRGQGASFGGMSNWIFNFAVVFSFMDFTTRFSHAGTFAIYAFFGLLAFYFIWKFLPETNGKKLD